MRSCYLQEPITIRSHSYLHNDAPVGTSQAFLEGPALKDTPHQLPFPLSMSQGAGRWSGLSSQICSLQPPNLEQKAGMTKWQVSNPVHSGEGRCIPTHCWVRRGRGQQHSHLVFWQYPQYKQSIFVRGDAGVPPLRWPKESSGTFFLRTHSPCPACLPLESYLLLLNNSFSANPA